MNTLQNLKRLSSETISLIKTFDNKLLNNIISNLFTVPIIRLDEAYSNFISSIGQDASVYDLWLTLQFNFYSELGERAGKSVNDFISMYSSVMESTPGANSGLLNIDNLRSDHSLFLVVALRTLGGSFTPKMYEVDGNE